MQSIHAIEVADLTKSFGKRKVIDGINMTVKAGDVFGFLGPNGSGKTTTIRMLLGLIHPDNGSVFINGYSIDENFSKAIERVGAIVETPKFYPYLTGWQNLQLMANLIRNLPRNRVYEVLEMVRLLNRANDRVKTYSLGMKQRLGIANALLNNPSLVILDEPTNGLDPQGMREIRELVSQLSSENHITFFISTHLLSEVEQMCNSVAILKEGKILIQGSVHDLIKKEFESIEVHTTNVEKAINTLQNVSYIRSIERFPWGVTAELEKGNSSKLNQYLVSQNIEVSYLIPKGQSLENIFLELTQGGKQIV